MISYVIANLKKGVSWLFNLSLSIQACYQVIFTKGWVMEGLGVENHLGPEAVI